VGRILSLGLEVAQAVTDLLRMFSPNQKRVEMLAPDFLKLKLVRLGADDVWSCPQDGLCFLLARAGSGRCSVGPAAHSFAPGDLLILPGTAEIRFQAATTSEVIFSFFSLRLEHLYPLFAGSEISLLDAVADSLHEPRHFPAAGPLAKQCHRLVEEVPAQSNLDHRSQLLRVVAVVLTEEFRAGHERRAGSLGIEEHLLQIFEQLSADELLTITVGELAAKFSCSRRHLNRLFHQYFGFSVASLRMEMRLLKAVSLLRDPNAKIINIAEQCGFNHLGLFNTCFRRRFGTSPGQWRKQAGQLEPAIAMVSKTGSSCPLHPKGLCPLSGGSLGLFHSETAVPALPPGNLGRVVSAAAAGNAKTSAKSASNGTNS